MTERPPSVDTERETLRFSGSGTEAGNESGGTIPFGESGKSINFNLAKA